MNLEMSAVEVDPRQFALLADRPHDTSVCICCHEVASQNGKLIDLGDLARLMLDLIERYLLHMLTHYRIVALIFAK